MQKKENHNIPEVNGEEWSVRELHQQSSNELPDETLRKTARGDEEQGNPDNRDVVGNVNSNETPQGREEAKNDTRSKANRNG
jgi:hypothetical protein